VLYNLSINREKFLFMSNETSKNNHLTIDDFNEIEEWLETQKDTVPLKVFEILRSMIELCKNAKISIQDNKKLLILLREKMGFIPKKEREGKNDKTIVPEWNKDTEDKLALKAKKASENLREYKKNRPPRVREFILMDLMPNPQLGRIKIYPQNLFSTRQP